MKIIKNIAASVFMLGAMLTITSCEKEEFKYSGESFIHYEKTTYQVNENASDIIKIPVFLATTSHPGNVTADVTFGGEAIEGEHYTVLEGQKLSFAEGVYSDTIKVQLIDNEEVDGNKTISFTLSGNSANYTIGYPNTENNAGSTILTIVDNDCPFEAANFIGSYTGKYNNLAGTDPLTATSDIKQDETDPNVFLISNFWGEGKTVRVTMNGDALTAVIPYQTFEAVNFYGYGPAIIESLATTVAPVGTITPCEGKFTVTFRVRVSAGSFGNYKVTFTR